MNKGANQIPEPKTRELPATASRVFRYLRIRGEWREVRRIAQTAAMKKKLHARKEKVEMRFKDSTMGTYGPL